MEGQFSLYNCIKPILFLKDVGGCQTGVAQEESWSQLHVTSYT